MDTPTLKKFSPLTPSQVTKLTADMQTKSCELDPISTHVLKQMVPVLISTVTHIMNTSLQPHLLLQRGEDLNGKTTPKQERT